MSDSATEAARLVALRRRAAARLGGLAAQRGDADGIAAALCRLYTLASTPATAGDALALLHELQVHQVELDLQAEELHESRAEAESALRQLEALHDALPVGCITFDERLVIRAANCAGAALLGLAPGGVAGVDLVSRLAASSRQALGALLADVPSFGDVARGALRMAHGEGVPPLHAHLRRLVNRDVVLVLAPDGGA